MRSRKRSGCGVGTPSLKSEYFGSGHGGQPDRQCRLRQSPAIGVGTLLDARRNVPSAARPLKNFASNVVQRGVGISRTRTDWNACSFALKAGSFEKARVYSRGSMSGVFGAGPSWPLSQRSKFAQCCTFRRLRPTRASVRRCPVECSEQCAHSEACLAPVRTRAFSLRTLKGNARYRPKAARDGRRLFGNQDRIQGSVAIG